MTNAAEEARVGRDTAIDAYQWLVFHQVGSVSNSTGKSWRSCSDRQAIATTLLPIIQHHVAPGTVVWPDEWAAYNHVASLPNVSTHVVNDSVEFVSPSGVHTQNVESY